MDIANVLEMQQQQYSRYELGTNEIPVRHVITLCKFYGISSDWLLGLTDTF
jgi:transcriptional regulator with XRE-family HTH domain